MELRVNRYSLDILPDDFNEDQRELDTAFIEEVLGLKKGGDWVKCTRKNALRLSCLALLEIKKTRCNKGVRDE